MTRTGRSGAAVSRYLEKRADLASRPLVVGALTKIEQVVVIPVLAEGGTLFDTVSSLATNPVDELARTLVICVVNNRAEEFADAAASADDIADNAGTLARLKALLNESESDAPGLRLGFIDASSPGKELPPKGGVGLARKLGLDWALAVLRDNDATSGALMSLDGDTLVEPNYLSAVREHFERPDRWAASIAFSHRIEDGAPEQAAILCYETFLRYHVLGLAHAGSPYAFHSVGSAMACSGEAYAAIGGMNARQAGEDFYFLQQLAKTGRVNAVHTTTVHPSSRESHRVPFGTGQRVRRFLTGMEQEGLGYDPRSYRILKAWLEAVNAHIRDDGQALFERGRAIAPALAAFLEARGFAAAWDNVRGNVRHDAGEEAQLLAQFHRWFDGFETIKLLHYLRDNGYPDQDLFDSLGTLLEWGGYRPPSEVNAGMRLDLARQTTLLRWLRERETAAAAR